YDVKIKIASQRCCSVSIPACFEIGSLLPLGGDLRTGALDNGEKFLLFFVGYLELVEGRLQIPEGGVEFRIADVHSGMRGFHFLAVVMGRPAGGKDDELNKVLFEIGDVLIRRVPSDGATTMDGESAALYP